MDTMLLSYRKAPWHILPRTIMRLEGGEAKMKNRCLSGAIACVGAVIGAGFASGREIVTFFTQYGVHSWWLVLLSALMMTALCVICMRSAAVCQTECWCELYQQEPGWVGRVSKACATLLMAVTGGAMSSAAGHMVALVWANEWAYPIGVVGTLLAAWALGFRSLRPLSWISGVLTALFLIAIVAVLSKDPPQTTLSLIKEPNAGELAWAAVRAVAYAAMNLTLGIGVVCRCSRRSRRDISRLSVAFGLMLIALLFLSNYLYAKHPELMNEAFPLVRLMALFGRGGFLVSVVMMYLAIFTSLVAVLYAVRGAVETHITSPYTRALLTMGLPLAISCVGFSDIVDGLYAPAGMICLAAVFGPLVCNRLRQK